MTIINSALSVIIEYRNIESDLLWKLLSKPEHAEHREILVGKNRFSLAVRDFEEVLDWETLRVLSMYAGGGKKLRADDEGLFPIPNPAELTVEAIKGVAALYKSGGFTKQAEKPEAWAQQFKDELTYCFNLMGAFYLLTSDENAPMAERIKFRLMIDKDPLAAEIAKVLMPEHFT